jgi:Subtilase family
MPIKTLSQAGVGSEEVIAQGIRTAMGKRADIILLPLGAREGSPKIEAAVKEALNTGFLVVAAAGNDGGEQPNSPASVPGVIAAGAVDASGRVPQFSNRGPNVLYAPGVNILTLGEDGKLLTISGTSFSSTIAAAFAANVWAAKGILSAQQIRDLLIKTSIDLGPVDAEKPQLGTIRRIDATAALRA